MNDKNDCKIVQDLLPNYIENLTTDETNSFINEHIENCEECKNMLNSMKYEFENKNILKTNKKEINYMKKYNRKLRIFIGIILVIFIVFMADFVRKLVIYNDLQNKLDTYKNANNYYMKVTQYWEGNLDVTMKFKKDDKYMIRHENLSTNNDLQKSISRVYSSENEDTANWYVSSGDQKYSYLNDTEKGLTVEIPEYWYEEKESLPKYLKMVLFSSVSTQKCNGKDCYKIEKPMFKEDKLLCLEYNEEYIYVEKDTGLVIRNEYDFVGVIDYKYSFGSVTDKTLEEPDINEYKEIKEEDYMKQIMEHEDIVSNENVDYIEIEVQNKAIKDEISYTEPLKLEKHYKIYDLCTIIDSGEKFENFEDEYGAGDYFEGCPMVTIYMKNGKK